MREVDSGKRDAEHGLWEKGYREGTLRKGIKEGDCVRRDARRGLCKKGTQRMDCGGKGTQRMDCEKKRYAEDGLWEKGCR